MDEIYNYYPVNINPYELHYNETVEFKKLIEVLSNPPLKKVSSKILERLKAFYEKDNVQDMTLFDWGNPCYHFRADVKNDSDDWDTFIIFVSVISKHFYLYVNHDLWKEKQIKNQKDYHKILDILSSELEGYKLLDSSIAKEVIPDIAYEHKEFGEVTVLNCLFTTHIY